MTPPANGNGPRGNGRPRNGNGSRKPTPFARHHRRRRQRRRQERVRRRRVVAFTVVSAVVALVLAIAGGTLTGATTLTHNCDLASLRPVTIGQNSFVYAADGSVLGSIPAEKNREPVHLEQMSKWVPVSTVAIEDRRFYQHGGLDYEGIFRALVRNLESGRIVEGGSTITQQLVRNLYIGNERSLQRKVKEACLAIKLDKAWSKERILETYLNQVYFGNHAYGIEAASQTYFSKHASKLTLLQAALLVGLPQAPSVYDPFTRPGDALARRNEVLQAMATNGDLTPDEYAVAIRKPLRLRAGDVYTKIREPYFFSYVRDQLVEKYGANTVRSGGLRVYTTIIPRYQRLAISAIKRTLYLKSDPASAIVSIDPDTGAIRAMTAVIPGKRRIQFNLAAQGRRLAGSAFKPFTLTTAILQGANPATTHYLSAPFHWQPDPTCPTSDPNCVWDVATDDNAYYGPSNLVDATVRSDNTVYARLALDVGPENIVRTAHLMGIRSKLQPVPSITLGTQPVSVLEMASAYATFAAGGIRSKPMAIRKVVLPNGSTDKDAGWGKPERKRVISDGVAYEVTKILEQNIQRGTGTGANIGRPAAGKTGTHEDFKDAWFCGYTPNLTTAVWVGYPKAEIPMRDVHGIEVFGGTFPATIWRLFMSGALAGVPAVDFPLPLQPPLFKPFHGQYAMSGAPTTTSAGTSGPTSSSTSTSAPPPTSTSAPPPTTTAPPPTTTAPATTTTP